MVVIRCMTRKWLQPRKRPRQHVASVHCLAPRRAHGSQYSLESMSLLHSTFTRTQTAFTRTIVSAAGTAGYQSIGSFHSENLEDLMARSDDDYIPPELPFDNDMSAVSLSVSLNKDHDFLVNRKEWTFLNHGAFGAALQCGYNRAQQWRFQLEQQPLQYFDRDLLPHLVHSARQLSSFGHFDDKRGIALIPNVTSALNSILQGYIRTFQQDAKIVLWDTSYGSVKKMAMHYAGMHNVVEIPFQRHYLAQLATSTNNNNDDMANVFVQALEDTLSHSKYNHDSWNNALLILDQTTSNTALNMPIELLARHAKEHHGMLVLVDGAHGLLAQDTSSLFKSNENNHQDIDFYTTNGHKWLSCPRGVAMLYCPKEELRNTVLRQPAIVSHGIDDGYFSRFAWDGCRDYAAQLSLPVVLDYWNQKDPIQVRRHLRHLLTQAIQVLADLWHDGCDPESWAPRGVTLAPMGPLLSPMALVELPPSISGGTNRGSKNPKTSADAKQIQDYLYDQRIEVPIKCINGILYVRLSCHMYNELHEYERLGRVLLQYPTL